MNEKIIRLLGLKAKDQEEISEAIGPFKSVAEFMNDIVEATKDSNFIAIIASSTPWWLQAVGESLGEAAPILKFIYKLIGKLGEIRDPDKLAYIAFTLAYQKSMEKAFIYVGSPSKLKTTGEWKFTKDISLPTEGFSFGKYSLKDPLNHDFIKEADSIIKEASKTIGYNDNEIRIILGEIHMRFPYTLKNILTHPQTREKFVALSDALSVDNTEERVHSAWKDHFEYLRFLFEDKPVFGEENFTLSDIYVETECGIIDCGDLYKIGNKGISKVTVKGSNEDLHEDPFNEKFGGRFTLIDSIISLIGDKDFRDAIIVQGPAGSGKSAFTLRLSVELLRQGLYPIRIRFRDLMLQYINIEDALPEAIRFWDLEERPGELPKARPNELFLGLSIFDQTIDFGNTKICPWVIILDGWDEVSIAAQKGFAVRVNEILTQVYDRFILRGNRPPVRVILTGRPSDAVMSSSFIKKQTKLLTIRPLNPDLLTEYIGSLVCHLTKKVSDISVNTNRFKPIIENYKENYPLMQEPSNMREIDGKMEIFGLPLLTHLAVRLITSWPEDNVQKIIENPTDLYRLLTDLTCGKGGRYGKDVYETTISEHEIRKLLHETAIAMTVYGKDNIPYDELDLRLSQLNEELIERVQTVTKDHPVTSLMINFFFKGGQKQLGAEFLHKSFREYLFAEAIVETLKEYGNKAPYELPSREDNLYWKDFDSTDIRYEFSRRIGQILAPQWISKEVSSFLEGLLKWEFARTYGLENDSPLGNSTVKLEIEGWRKVRNGLADLWCWWGEGILIRPQPVIQGKKITSWNRTIADEFIFWAMNQNEEKGIIPIAARIVSMDSHLGNALFQLNVFVHHFFAIKNYHNTKWLPIIEEKHLTMEPLRAYQSYGVNDGEIKIRFKPTGPNHSYFLNYIHRINASGWHPGTIFPSSMFLQSVDFDDASLIMTGFASCNLAGATFRNSNLIGSLFMNSNLTNVDFSRASLRHVDFENSNIEEATFDDNVYGSPQNLVE
jgi:hypothetical protein